ncbi:MAG: folylpolyglutamate synthase/dihydrofolate synthase family protein [Flavobacteriales bacterium]
MNYAETLAYLYERLPMFHRIGKAAYKADLTNTLALMELTDHPERGLKCVHVAGTNGKGSTSHLIASALQEAGLKTGLHTSPHLKDFRERFRINGHMVPEETVVRFVDRYRSVFETVDASFFEWGVAFALWWFREQEVDIAVIEVGMGGRLDSTNVVTPEVSVITNIGWDHVDLLGGSLEAIAGEKAGIMKPGTPVVVGEASGTIADVFIKRAKETGSPLHFVDQTIPLSHTSGLVGPHQERNARAALAAIHQLRAKKWTVPEEAIERGFRNVIANTGLMGRWQALATAPLTIADVAHNADGLRVVRTMLARTPHRRLHVVFGSVNDKDIGRALAELPHHAKYYFCKADIPRGLDAGSLREQAAQVGLIGEAYGSVADALKHARSNADNDDLVLVTGSVFVVAEVL